MHVSPIDRRCEICKRPPGEWCVKPDGKRTDLLHATRLRQTTEVSKRDAERYRRGGARGNKAMARRKR